MSSSKARLPLLVMVTSLMTVLAMTLAALLFSSPSASATVQEWYPVRVYFTHVNGPDNDPLAVYPVNRMSPDLGVASYAIQELIAGPTPAEYSSGYYSELGTMLSGYSNCASSTVAFGPTFKIFLNKKGDVDEPYTATLKFCRTITSAGTGQDARVRAMIDTTLKQFSSIRKVVILDHQGNCFGDMSGENLCLR